MEIDRTNSDSTQIKAESPNWGPFGEVAKYTAVLALMIFSVVLVRKKLGDVTWEQLWGAMQSIPPYQIWLAVLFTCINFVVLTGYDLIAVRYLKKKLPLHNIMVGAIIGYALSNVFGWLVGGNIVRFRLYSSWGFRLIEVVALVSILSVTFWLGMFLLAGIAFVLLPVHLPADYQELLHFSPYWYGLAFLGVVGAYLLATIFVRKPIHIGNQEFAFPPFRLSLLQLAVSATDFALASLVLYILLPPGTEDYANYSTVLVSYLAAMIVVVVVHAPGGIGVLELVVITILTKHAQDDGALKVAVFSGLLLFRLIYYVLPAIVAGVLLIHHEYKHARKNWKTAAKSKDTLSDGDSRENRTLGLTGERDELG